MFSDSALMQYIIDSIDDSSLFLTKFRSYGSRVFLRQGPENIAASVAPASDIWELHLPNIEMLKPVLGEDYWWAATGEQFGFGASSQLFITLSNPLIQIYR
jgi:hypothetical protein